MTGHGVDSHLSARVVRRKLHLCVTQSDCNCLNCHTLLFVYFITEVCTVQLDGQIEVTGSSATYSFTGVGSGISGYVCKMDGVILPDCMLLFNRWIVNIW